MCARHACVWWLIAAGALVTPSSALADDVTLVNGNRLVGRILHKTGDILELDTKYAGLLKIKWSDVIALSTDKPVEILLVGDERPRRAVLISAYDGSVDLIGDASDVPFIHIAFINPTPEESGLGALYSARINASSTHARGNVHNDQNYLEGELTARSRDYRYTIGGKVADSSDAGRQVASSWLVAGNYDLFLSEKRFLYLRGSRESDRFKGIYRRSTVGTGYGFQFIETLRINVSLRGGIDYVTLHRISGETEDYPAFGWGVRATYKLSDRGTELFHEQDGFQNLNNTRQITVRSRSGLRVPLFSGLNMSVQLNVDWDREPSDGRKPTDTTLLFGLGYAW